MVSEYKWDDIQKGDIVTLEHKNEAVSGSITFEVYEKNTWNVIFFDDVTTGLSPSDWELVSLERPVPEPPVGSIVVFSRVGDDPVAYKRVSEDEAGWDRLYNASGPSFKSDRCIWKSLCIVYGGFERTVVEK